jgi:hypothetical protein
MMDVPRESGGMAKSKDTRGHVMQPCHVEARSDHRPQNIVQPMAHHINELFPLIIVYMPTFRCGSSIYHQCQAQFSHFLLLISLCSGSSAH